MLCLGPKKSLSSLRLELMAQGMAQCTDDQSQVWYHLAIQAPRSVHSLYTSSPWPSRQHLRLDHQALDHWLSMRILLTETYNSQGRLNSWVVSPLALIIGIFAAWLNFVRKLLSCHKPNISVTAIKMCLKWYGEVMKRVSPKIQCSMTNPKC